MARNMWILGVCVETATVFYFKTKVSATVVTNSTRARSHEQRRQCFKTFQQLNASPTTLDLNHFVSKNGAQEWQQISFVPKQSKDITKQERKKVIYGVLPTESLVDLCMVSLVTNGYHFQGVLIQQLFRGGTDESFTGFQLDEDEQFSPNCRSLLCDGNFKKYLRYYLYLFLASKAGMYIMSICVVLFLIFYLLDFLSSSYC